MRLVSYETGAGPRGGLLSQGAIYDLEILLEASSTSTRATASVRGFLEVFGGELSSIAPSLESIATPAEKAYVGARDDVVLVAPVPDPHKVLCVGLNYVDHVAETGRALPEYPDVFAKFASTMVGADAEIGGSVISEQLDFEGEVAVVIGRTARNVPESEALAYVAGLSCLNDVTARDLQYRGTQWLAGKAVDGSTPWGPSIVTLDEIGDPQSLGIVTRVNGVEMQRSSTTHQIFPIARIVAYLSTFLALRPGDVIATGTPQGIGAKRVPPVWLHPGDTVEVEVERVGRLCNTVGRA